VNVVGVYKELVFDRYFDVIKLEGPQWDEDSLRIAVNSAGVYVLGPNKRLLLEMTFPDIITIRGERWLFRLWRSSSNNNNNIKAVIM